MEQMRNEINELIEQSKQKAKVLTEALPYIRRFNNCYVVVKYGGSDYERQESSKKRDQRCCTIKTSRYETDHRTWWWKRDQ